MTDERPEHRFDIYLEGDRSVRVYAANYVFERREHGGEVFVLRDAAEVEVAFFKRSQVVGIVRADRPDSAEDAS